MLKKTADLVPGGTPYLGLIKNILFSEMGSGYSVSERPLEQTMDPTAQRPTRVLSDQGKGKERTRQRINTKENNKTEICLV